MKQPKFTDEANYIKHSAQLDAKKLRHAACEPAHGLAAFLQHTDSIGGHVLASHLLDPPVWEKSQCRMNESENVIMTKGIAYRVPSVITESSKCDQMVKHCHARLREWFEQGPVSKAKAPPLSILFMNAIHTVQKRRKRIPNSLDLLEASANDVFSDALLKEMGSSRELLLLVLTQYRKAMRQIIISKQSKPLSSRPLPSRR